MDFWDRTFLDNPLRAWVTAVGVAAISTLAFWLLTHVAVKYFRRFSRRTETDLDDLAVRISSKTKYWLLVVIALYLGSRALAMPPLAASWARAVTVIAFLVQIALWGDALVTSMLLRYQTRRDADHGAETTVKVAAVIIRFALYILIGLIALDNIPGIQVTTLIASLGIGGIAVALAVQNILGDLFASLIIVLDRPFAIGDFVKVDDFMGTVEAIGLKTTRVRSYTGEEVVFGNSDLLGSRLRNFRTLSKRLVITTVGVTQTTPHEKLVRVPDILRKIVEPIEHAEFARASLSEIAASSFDYQLVYSTLTSDFGLHMEIRQTVNLGIIERFEREGIELAYPTHVVFVGAQSEDG